MKFKFPHPGTTMLLVFTTVFVLMAFLSGCTTQTISHVEPMAYCDGELNAALLVEPCQKSQKLADGAVYQDSLNANRTANSSLDQCSLKAQKLQEAIANCHRLVDQHNKVIQSLNKP